jgi:hypothetical protein
VCGRFLPDLATPRSGPFFCSDGSSAVCDEADRGSAARLHEREAVIMDLAGASEPDAVGVVAHVPERAPQVYDAMRLSGVHRM